MFHRSLLGIVARRQRAAAACGLRPAQSPQRLAGPGKSRSHRSVEALAVGSF
jgi:hypothetical protein